MLQITSSGNGASRVTGGSKNVSVFTPKPIAADDIHLLSKPEENPHGDLSWPGEYDVGGVTLRGIGHDDGQQTSWLAVIDGIRIAFPSTPLHEWTDHELQVLGDVHVLVVVSEDAKKVQKLLEEIDPRILILLEGAKGFDPEVLKACGAVGKEQVSDYKIKGSLPAEGREVVLLAK